MTKPKPKQPEAPPATESQLGEREVISAAYALSWAIGEVATAKRLRDLAHLVERGLTLH